MTDLKGSTISPPPPGVLALSNGTVNDSVTVRSGSVLRNLTINGDIIVDADIDGLEVTHCSAKSFRYAGQAFFLVQNTKLVANIFEPTDAGSFTCIFVGNPGNNLVVTDNILRNAHEGIHVMDGLPGATGLVISFNEISGIRRHGIECQMHCFGAVCEGNLLHKWRKNLGDTGTDPPSDGRIVISWACGPTTDRKTNSTSCKILRNVMVGDGECGWPMAQDSSWRNGQIEWMGDQGEVAGNYAINGGGSAFTWCRNWTAHDNVWIGMQNPIWSDESPAEARTLNWHDSPQVSGDRKYALNDPGGPPQPAAGPRVTPGPSNATLPASGAPVITPSNQPQANMITDLVGKVSGVGAITWTWTPIATPLHYAIRATHAVPGTSNLAEGDLAAGVGSIGAFNIPDLWECLLTLSANGVVLATSNVQYLSKDVPPVPAIQPLDLTGVRRALVVLQAEIDKLQAAAGQFSK